MPDIQTRLFGKSQRAVTLVGLGGEGVLRTFNRTDEAISVIGEAVDQNITYFDCAPAYAGSQVYYGSYWQGHPGARAKIFQASKSARRDKDGALSDLDNTLKTMGIDHLDLWQIHDVRTREDIEEIESGGGALEAFIEAKRSGKARNIGVTGHHDPDILTYAVEHWPVDSVLLPVSPVEAALGGFMDRTIPAAMDKGIAVIAMKVLGHGEYVIKDAGITAEQLLRYALTQPVTVVIAGCMDPGQVRELAHAGINFEPMEQDEQHKLVDIFKPYARKLAYYRGVY